MVTVPRKDPVPLRDHIEDFCCGSVKMHFSPSSAAISGDPSTYTVVEEWANFRE